MFDRYVTLLPLCLGKKIDGFRRMDRKSFRKTEFLMVQVTTESDDNDKRTIVLSNAQ